jgi:phenylalanine-4-hydroxylase
MGRAPDDVPAHLRRFVVEQDYAQYNAMDQAVWRFVLLQMNARLADTAHAIYRRGLQATGISVERIPRVADMNERMSRFGWGAVCVDGFIPPRAFQEFQACGLLPVAGAIRTRQHLPYTPAPDIIHEAAGHAPILPDPVFAAYLRLIGELGAQAFTIPEEDRTFRAIYDLSEVKEAPTSTAAEIRQAEAELEAAIAGAPEASEAARLARLYWWTAEYGLVGAVDQYKVYGAGLLSSLGESHSCHAAGVRKAVLDESCVDVGYDITRPQPRLFVVPSFEALHDVLDRVARNLAVNLGGAEALRRARQSRELASVGFSSGAWVMGTLREVGPMVTTGAEAKGPAWLSFEGPSGFAWDGETLPQQRNLGSAGGQLVLTGQLDDGRALASLDGAALVELRDPASGRHRFRFASGALVEGVVEQMPGRHPDGRLMHVELHDVAVALPGGPSLRQSRLVLLATGEVVHVRAGAVDPRFYVDTGDPDDGVGTAASAAPVVRVPRPRIFPEGERRLLELCTQAERAHRAEPQTMRAVFARTHAALVRDFPDEWLLRWNLLESLRRVGPIENDEDAGSSRALEAVLVAELELLEVKLDHREPIDSGLRYLDQLIR